jgi:4-amino-4-deoxy-L-arabinose transferase-like glycosyltransferase
MRRLARRHPAPTVLLLAFAVRAVYAVAMWLIAGDEGLQSPDSAGYIRSAEEFVAGLAAGTIGGWDLLGLEIDRMPIPAWLMALCRWVFGDGHVLGYVLVQGAVDAATCLIVARIAGGIRRDLFWPAAICAILNPTMVVVAGIYLTDTVFLLFCALMFLGVWRWVEAGTWRNVLLIGVALGLATLSRTFTFAFIPVLALAMVVAGLIARRPLPRSLLQGALAAVVALTCVSPILVRNYTGYAALSMTPQSGIHMLAWQVSLVREAADGTPFAESAAELQQRFDATHPDLDRENPFTVSGAMTAMALEELGRLGPGPIAEAWTIGAAINMASPAATVSPVVGALPRTGFYDTPGEDKLDKIYAFLFENENALYAWILALGVLGVAVLRLVQLRGAWRWLGAGGPARLYLAFAVLWMLFVLAVSGPVASPKYRLPVEPFLVIALAFGIAPRAATSLPSR